MMATLGRPSTPVTVLTRHTPTTDYDTIRSNDDVELSYHHQTTIKHDTSARPHAGHDAVDKRGHVDGMITKL